MPIRMTDDPIDPNQQDDSGGGGRRRPSFPGGGGGGGLMSLLPMLMGLFKGKGIILLLVLAAGAYFLLGRSGGCNVAEVVKKFSQSGYNFDPAEFNKASVYEGLEDDAGKNPLPEAVSLLRFAPDRLNQGQQGSCVAWSCAYGAQTILTAAASGTDPNSIRFSPSYLYNQIKLEGCQGSYLQRAMESMSRNGGVPLSQYPYNDQDCDREPSSSDIQRGRQNVIHGFTRITNGDNINEISVRGIKEHLAKNAPVAIGMMVGQSFMQNMMGQELWTPQGMDESQMGMGGHAMCVIGYDDRKFGGAFQIMNSWGPEWGQNGVAWVRYGDFKNYVREAYGIDPLPKRSNVANIPLECAIGLVNNADKQNISLRTAGGNLFQTTSPIKVGTRFKMSIENATECYIYVFGQEVDGSSYVLFPYLKQGETVSKHSPYCGITGYRLFPKAQSMEADSIGTKDYIAIVVSKEELDYNSINNAISQSRQTTYAAKVNEALRPMLISSARFNSTNDGRIYFKVDANSNKAVAAIVAFDKNK
ncbi:MAG TPA: C1 family peptidase [Chitinophagaceae bacterium]|nr:C1 family peptidase [Chitinophagaceae bacterium]